MQADLPMRLAVRIGCVENSVSGTAMRPLDVVRTRRGLTVEIGNTDAEGRLVLCDLLAEASDENPDLLLDAATLTGAARVALGPDMPALFCNDDDWAEALLAAGKHQHDPLWRLPLWKGYDSWLDSPVADLNNVASKPMAGAIVAALFMERFVAPGVPWAHLDTGGMTKRCVRAARRVARLRRCGRCSQRTAQPGSALTPAHERGPSDRAGSNNDRSRMMVANEKEEFLSIGPNGTVETPVCPSLAIWQAMKTRQVGLTTRAENSQEIDGIPPSSWT